jgi:hypothetical protein
MSQTPYAGQQTRTWWAGTDADQDIHIEAYEGTIDGSFRVDSMFRTSSLTSFKSVQNQSNAWRGDRIGSVTVGGRKAGDALTAQRIPNEKFVITVDFTSFIRTPFDYQDEWTAPDFSSEYAAEHATAHAKTFDNAHVIQLIKAGQWVAPADLAGAFNNGIYEPATGYAAALATDDETAADVIVKYHKAVLKEFVKRDLGASLNQFVTLLHPDWFSVLLDHKKLMNVQFMAETGGNNFVQRRIATLNGTPVIETPRFPADNSVAGVLGPAFNLTTDELKARMIVFLPSKTLVTVEAQPMTVRKWDDPLNFQSVLDSYLMYTVGIRRGDACAVITTDES